MTDVADLTDEKLERKAKIASENLGTSETDVWESSFRVAIEELADRRDKSAKTIAEEYVGSGVATRLLRDRETPGVSP